MATEAEELHKELEQIKQGVANLTLAWASVENGLVVLLSHALSGQTTIVSAMYFSLTSLDSRMGVVDAALGVLFEKSVATEAFDTEWKYLSNKFNRLKKVRNKVAHGEIVSGYYPNYGSRMRLTSPLLDFAVHIAAIEGNTLPGLGSNELQHATVAVKRLSSALMNLGPAVSVMKLGNAEASREILVRLTAQRQSQGSEYIQSPEAPDGQPPASGE